MLSAVKKALRLTVDAYDEELNDLISAALADLGIAGVDQAEHTDPLIKRAVITYCRVHFGSPEDGEFQRLKESYDEQKAQLQMATGYTDWRDGTDE